MLPDDDQLVHREKLWTSMFEKFSIDEGSDAEIVDDDFLSNGEEDELEENADILECSVSLSNRDEDDNFDMDEMTNQLKPFITERVSAWPAKGVNLLLKTVDPSVTVEEWIQGNSQCTTTTTEVKKTVIDKLNKTITKSTRRTIVTTETIQMIMPLRPVKKNHDQTENKIKSIMDASHDPKKKSQSPGKNRSNAMVLKQKIPKIAKQLAANQQNSAIISRTKSIGTSTKVGNQLQSTETVIPDRNETQSIDNNESNEIVRMEKTTKKFVRACNQRKNPTTTSSRHETIPENMIEKSQPRHRLRKRKPEDIKPTKNTKIKNYSNITPTNTESPSTCDSDVEVDVLTTYHQSIAPSFENTTSSANGSKLFHSLTDSDSEDDTLATNFLKLVDSNQRL